MTNEELKALLEMYGISEEEFMQRYEAAMRARQKAQAERVAAYRRAAERQVAIDEQPSRRYAVIVAVDAQGGFSRNGEIPWNYPEDFRWFKQITSKHVCVMGRNTYEDINRRRGEKAKDILLPNRKSFVLTSSDREYTNATAIKGIAEIETHLNDDDFDKTIFFIGGERVFTQGVGMADTIYMTVINNTFNCDQMFPVKYVTDNFSVDKVYENKAAADLRFLVWKRTTEL